MMSFKQWINELVYPGEPEKERPDLLATALPGIHRDDEDPPKNIKTPTSNYAIKTRYLKKRCLKV